MAAGEDATNDTVSPYETVMVEPSGGEVKMTVGRTGGGDTAAEKTLIYTTR